MERKYCGYYRIHHGNPFLLEHTRLVEWSCFMEHWDTSVVVVKDCLLVHSPCLVTQPLHNCIHGSCVLRHYMCWLKTLVYAASQLSSCAEFSIYEVMLFHKYCKGKNESLDKICHRSKVPENSFNRDNAY